MNYSSTFNRTIASILTAAITYTSFLPTAKSGVVQFKNGEVIVGVDNIVYDELLEQTNRGRRLELTSYLGKLSPYTAEEVQAGISRLTIFGREPSAFYQEGMSLDLTEENKSNIYLEEMCLTPERAWKKSFELEPSNTLSRVEQARETLERKAIILSDFFLELYDRVSIYGEDRKQVLWERLEHNRRYFLEVLKEYRELFNVASSSKSHKQKAMSEAKEQLLEGIVRGINEIIRQEVEERKEKRLALEEKEKAEKLALEQFKMVLHEQIRRDPRLREYLRELKINPEYIEYISSEEVERLSYKLLRRSPEEIYKLGSYDLSRLLQQRSIEMVKPPGRLDFMRRRFRGK